jgi:hypothetical protein
MILNFSMMDISVTKAAVSGMIGNEFIFDLNGDLSGKNNGQLIEIMGMKRSFSENIESAAGGIYIVLTAFRKLKGNGSVLI